VRTPSRENFERAVQEAARTAANMVPM
jgi:hypothetical protein